MITRENYEAFYLDFLEGSLSKEMEKAFLAFLAANPDLQMDEELPFLNEEEVALTEFDKLLLKKQDDKAIIITKQNIEFYLIAQLENQLSNEDKVALESWLNQHPEYFKDKALYAKTLLPNEHVAYLNKSSLRQETRIIPMWAKVSSAAASVILLLGIAANMNLNAVDVQNPGLPQFSRSNQTPDSTAPNNALVTPQPKQFAGKTFVWPFQTNEKVETPNQSNPNEQLANNPNEQEQQQNNNKENANPLTNENGGILPEQPDLATHVTEKQNHTEQMGNNDVAFGANPIEPITNELSKRLNTVVDFRRAKEAQDKPSGFFLKIGKFELMHKKGGKH